MAELADEASDSSTSTVKANVSKKRQLRCRLRPLQVTNFDPTAQVQSGQRNACVNIRLLQDSLDELRIEAGARPSMAHTTPSRGDDRLTTDVGCNNFDTSSSSEETLKACYANLRARNRLKARLKREQCISQLTRWAYESCRTGLTVAEILYRTQWEATRLERL